MRARAAGASIVVTLGALASFLVTPACSGVKATSDAGADVAQVCPSDTNFAEDAANCGRCGHPCRGAACHEGRCEPMEFASGASAADLAVAGGFVYWTNRAAGAVQRAPRASGTSAPSTPQTLVDGQSGAFGLAIDGGYVYFTAELAGSIARCPLDGCPSEPTPIASGQSRPEDLVVVGDMVVWGNTGDGTVVGAPKEGGAPVVIATAQTPRFLTSDGTNLYWLDGCNLVQHPLAPGGDNVVLAAATCGGSGLVLDGVLYASAAGSNVLVEVPEQGGAIDTLRGITDVPAGITSDASFVYWIDRSADGAPAYRGGLMRLPKSAFASSGATKPPPERLAPGGRGERVAVDDEYVYWTSLADPAGTIERVAK